ncbi:MAG: RidA family protein [Alphaproteobacteria bacterium]|nr:RidA family protein [Alphaproteobacteria bacterium]
MKDKNNTPAAGTAKYAPVSRQHSTAGPYSPVLEVSPEATLVVISGQAALDLDGNVVTDDFEVQSRITLENCHNQLRAANCTFADVFKVNVFLANLEDWPMFNGIYREMMPEPLPVRTAVQAGLLSSFQVEIEMWAAKKK